MGRSVGTRHLESNGGRAITGLKALTLLSELYDSHISVYSSDA